MKYILGLAIAFKKYQKPINVKLFADDYLIDEFELDKNAEVQVFDQPDKDLLEFQSQCDVGDEMPHSKLNYHRLYEINGDLLNKKIIIDIKCTDNNYTNGFMTKNAMIQLHQLWLAPKILYDNIDWWKKADQKSHEAEKKLNLVTRCLDYPFALNYTLIQPDKRIVNGQHWIGGNILAEVPIRKKFGVKILDDPEHENHLFKAQVTSNFIWLRHKINKANEDKRSN